MEKCEKCREQEAMEGYPVCKECFTRIRQWGTDAEKQRMRYYVIRERMEKEPEYKELVLGRRKQAARRWKQSHGEQFKAYQRKYKREHRDQWNAYQREYNRRKREETTLLRKEIAELKKQLASAQSVDK